jgi:chitinase
VTLTKPIGYATPTVDELTTLQTTITSTLYSTHYVTSHGSPVSAVPYPGKPASPSSAVPEIAYPSKEAEHIPVAYETPASVAKFTPTSTTVEVVYVTKAPVPKVEVPYHKVEVPEYTKVEVPYTTVNSTGAYSPGPTGTASGPGSAALHTYAPIAFEGAASRIGSGMSVVAVMVAGLLLL